MAPWDVAAVGLLIQEAGGLVTDSAGDDRSWLRGDIVAGGGAVHAGLIELLRVIDRAAGRRERRSVRREPRPAASAALRHCRALGLLAGSKVVRPAPRLLAF